MCKASAAQHVSVSGGGHQHQRQLSITKLVLFTLPTLFTLLQVQVCRALMRPRPRTVQHKAPLPRRGTDRGAPASACAPKSLGSAALLAGVREYDEAGAEIERRREALGLPTIDWAPDAPDAAQSLAALRKPTPARGGRRPPTCPVWRTRRATAYGRSTDLPCPSRSPSKSSR